MHLYMQSEPEGLAKALLTLGTCLDHSTSHGFAELQVPPPSPPIQPSHRCPTPFPLQPSQSRCDPHTPAHRSFLSSSVGVTQLPKWRTSAGPRCRVRDVVQVQRVALLLQQPRTMRIAAVARAEDRTKLLHEDAARHREDAARKAAEAAQQRSCDAEAFRQLAPSVAAWGRGEGTEEELKRFARRPELRLLAQSGAEMAGISTYQWGQLGSSGLSPAEVRPHPLCSKATLQPTLDPIRGNLGVKSSPTRGYPADKIESFY